MVGMAVLAAFLVWGAVERVRVYRDTPGTFSIAAVWAAGRLLSAVLNVLAGGGLHEPLSARTGRSASLSPRWRRAERAIDALFFTVEGHCAAAHANAQNRATKGHKYTLQWIWHDND